MPLAITHFSFPELPDSNALIALINAVPIVVDTQYPIANQTQLTFERQPAFDNLSLITAVKYKVHDSIENIVSNISLISLKWKGISATPASANISEVINNSDIKNLLVELPLNDVVEFIEIVSIGGVTNLKLNQSLISIGQRLTLLDLFYSNFTAEAEGGGDPYFTLTYKVGENNILESTIYSVNYEIISLAAISLLSGPTVTTSTDEYDPALPTETYGYIEELTEIEIDLGHAYANADITIAILSSFLLLNQWNSVVITINDIEYEYLTSQTISNQNVVLDEFGKATIKILNLIVRDTIPPYAPATGQITITLNNVNGDPALVDGTQVYQILTNL